MDILISPLPVPYPQALEIMAQRVEDIIASRADELLWILEHDACYTAGTSAQARDLLGVPAFPVYETGRGGQYTYHGPGQLVAYLMLDLKQRHAGAPDLRRYVFDLEQAVIDILAALGITGERREGRVGVWVAQPDGREDKIAAIGVRVRKWISSHGLSLNINPDLSHYNGIVPCGIAGHGVTSVAALGKETKGITELVTHALRRRLDPPA